MDIKRLLKSIEVDDEHILLKEPHKYIRHGIRIKVDQINYYYKWDKFSYWLGIFLQCYLNVSEAFKLPDSLKDLKAFQKNIKLTFKNIKHGKLAFKSILKLAKLSGFKVSAMKKKFTQDDWSELFAYIYLYNVLGVKKNLLTVLEVIKKAQSN
jgi:hypothetical protein